MMKYSTLSYFHSSPPPLSSINSNSRAPFFSQTKSNTFLSKREAWTRSLQTAINVSADGSNNSSNQRVTVTVTKDDDDDDNVSSRSSGAESACEIVRKFYEGINGHDLSSVEDLIAENCVYEDLIFPHPFVGRKAILEFFNKFNDSISTDLQFVIDDISAEDSLAVGVTWHLEWKGKPFPFSKGCSFYRLEVLNGKKQIIYGRDSVEPAIKPGESALVIIRGVAWLLQQFPQLADQLK